MNFGLFPMLERFKEFKHDWEQPYLEGSDERIFKQHLPGHRVHPDAPAPATARASSSSATTSATSTSCAHFLDRGLVKPPLFVQIGVRHPRRHRHASGGRRAHEAHRRPPVRQRIPLVACWAPAATRCRSRRWRRRWAATSASAWRTRCGSARASSPKSNAEQVRARAPDHRRPRARGRDAGRGARDPGAEGRRQGRVLGLRPLTGLNATCQSNRSRKIKTV